MGGGSRRRSDNDMDRLEELLNKAREELRRAETPGRKNVFLSFAYEDVGEVNLLRGQARNEHSELEFNDWSVQEPYESIRADYIKQRISERILQCSVTVVYLSAAAAQSRWVDWEIRRSLELGKAVVAVHSGDQPPPALPAAVADNKLRIVPWSRLSTAI